MVLAHGQAEKGEILRTQALPQLFIGKQVDQCLTAALDREIRLVVRIQPGAFMVKHVTLVQRRPPIDHPPLLRAETIVDRLVKAADVHPVYESRYGGEPRTDVVVNSFVGEMQPISFQIQFVRWAGAVESAEIAGTHHRLALEGPVGIEFEPRVDSTNAIEIVRGGIFPVRVNSSDARLPENIPAH